MNNKDEDGNSAQDMVQICGVTTTTRLVLLSHTGICQTSNRLRFTLHNRRRCNEAESKMSHATETLGRAWAID